MDTEEDLSPAEREAHDVVHAVVREARTGGFFDEEPPGRIDALLMAAARERAPAATTAPPEGWLARLRAWLAPALLHPAVAGAAAVVVVGGVAGVMYLRRGHEIAQPEPSRPSTASPAPPAGATADQPDLPPAFHTGGAESAGSPVTPPTLPEVRVDPTAGGPGAPKKPLEARGPRRGVGESGVVGTVGGDDAPGDVLADVDRPATDDERREKLGIATDGTPPGPEDPQRPAPDGAVAQPIVETTVVGADDRRDPAAKDRAQAEQLTKQARTAARRKDCGAVKVMAARVKKLDSAYYQATFAIDPAIKPCL